MNERQPDAARFQVVTLRRYIFFPTLYVLWRRKRLCGTFSPKRIVFGRPSRGYTIRNAPTEWIGHHHVHDLHIFVHSNNAYEYAVDSLLCIKTQTFLHSICRFVTFAIG